LSPFDEKVSHGGADVIHSGSAIADLGREASVIAKYLAGATGDRRRDTIVAR
jgi:hypothetical protein